jgi:hypothetical protein
MTGPPARPAGREVAKHSAPPPHPVGAAVPVIDPA